MGSKHDERVDPNQPALILMYGDGTRKCRALNREAVTIGRARGCDIWLDATDVSNLHCLVTRGADGYHLRDCASRSGTRVNGDVVREGTLHDGDILQVGPFSFRVHLAAERATAGPSPADPPPAAKGAPVTTTEDDRRLELRRQELDAYARHLGQLGRELRQRQEQAAQQHEQLTRGFQVMQREQQENAKMREEWAREQAEAGARLEQQRAALAQAEASLRDQRAELTRMMAELKQVQEAIRTQQNVGVEALRTENAQLHQLLADRDKERVEGGERNTPNDGATPDTRAEIDLLRQLLREKEALIEELRHEREQEPPPKPITDVDTYEAELNEFRRQLENDRKKLNEEIEQLRSRNLELDEATREMELELSRERAELARERQRLDRLREDARLELERAQRDAGVRERLAPLQKLREELSSGGQPEAGLAPRPRARLTDAPA